MRRARDPSPAGRGRWQVEPAADGAASARVPKLGGPTAADRSVVEHEVIVDPERIREVVFRLFSDGAPAALRGASAGAPHRSLRLARVQPERPLPLAFDASGAWAGEEGEILIFSPWSVYRFTPELRHAAHGLVATSMPRVLVRQRRRGGRRARAEGVRATFELPRAGARRAREVADVSLRGLALQIARADGLEVGDELALVLDWQERARVRLRGVVRHVSAQLEGTGEVAGVELALADDPDSARWRALVGRALWPHSVADGTLADDVWECLVESGYCSLSSKCAADFEDQRRAFAGALRSVAASPELGAPLVVPSGRGVEATLSTLRIYEHSHFLYAVAKQPGRTPAWIHGRGIVRELYSHAIERLEGDAGARWLIVWVQEGAGLTRTIHHELAARHAAAGRSEVSRVDVMEALPLAAEPASVPGNVGWATEAEIEHVLARIAELRSGAYVAAHDLVPERFALARLRRAWARSGLVRERAMIVVREGRDIAAAAIVELASEGLHLFRLFDTVRTFALTSGSERHYSDLLAAARRYFAERRKPTFVHVREDLDVPPPRGFRSLAATDVTLLSAELFPELLEHVFDRTASVERPPPPRIARIT